MSKKYDVTLWTLYEPKPDEWLDFLSFPVPDPSLLEVLDSNISIFSPEIDRAIRVGGPHPYIVHTEFLSGRDPGLPERSFWYNTVLGQKYHVPVWSVIVLLRPAADGPELTGVFEQSFPGRGLSVVFRYDVIRIWLEPPEKFLTAGLSVLPLAPVSNVAPEQLEAVLRGVAERLKREADPALMMTLWTAMTLLIGLRHKPEQVRATIEGVRDMVLGIRDIEESWVYQDILAKGLAKGLAEGEAKGRAEGEAKGRAEGRAEGRSEGRAEGEVEEARHAVLRLGRKKLGEPDERVLSRLADLGDLERLNLLLEGVLDAACWDDLLARLSS
jgi:predicted transposase YdaD